jgi:alcohol dehydrogenase
MTTHASELSRSVLRPPREILFGAGVRSALGRTTRGLGRRALVCSDPVIAASDLFAACLEDLRSHDVDVTVFSEFHPELPLADIDVARDRARTAGPDVVIGFGGGSSLDLAKIVAITTDTDAALSEFYGENRVPDGVALPVVAVPTTAGTGSEVTPVAVVADPARTLKVGLSSPHLVPTVAIVDPELTLTCPPPVSAHSGIDALTHAVESFTAGRRPLDVTDQLPVFIGANPLTAPLAWNAAAAIGPSLEKAVHSGHDLEARTQMAYGSLLAGLAFGAGGTHLSHALQYPIGHATHTSHGLGVGLLLPYVLEACLPWCTPELAQLADALQLEGVVPEGRASTEAGAVGVIRAIAGLTRRIGIPATLADIGIERSDLPALAEQAATVARLVGNAPAPDPESLLEPILAHALTGQSAIFSNPEEPAR